MSCLEIVEKSRKSLVNPLTTFRMQRCLWVARAQHQPATLTGVLNIGWKRPWFSVNHCGESGRNVPPRPAPTAHFYFPAWRNRRRRRHATRPAPAARSAVAPTLRSPANHRDPPQTRACDCARITVFCAINPGFSWCIAVKAEPGRRSVRQRANSRGLALSCRKRVASVEVAQAPGNRRAPLRATTPWIAPTRINSYL
ncbi:unnamed protein product, partial [Brenthis ino]